MQSNQIYAIGKFSTLVSLSIDTLRYYEKECLLKPKRDINNRRMYDATDIVWVEFLKRLKQTGMPIQKMKTYAQLRYAGDSTVKKRYDLLAEQQQLLLNKQQEINQHLAFLEEKLQTYQQMMDTTN